MDLSTVSGTDIDLTVNAKPYTPNRRNRRAIIKAQRPIYKKLTKKIKRERAIEARNRAIMDLRPSEGTGIVPDETPVIAYELGITRPLTQHERVILRRYGIDPRTISDTRSDSVQAVQGT